NADMDAQVIKDAKGVKTETLKAEVAKLRQEVTGLMETTKSNNGRMTGSKYEGTAEVLKALDANAVDLAKGNARKELIFQREALQNMKNILTEIKNNLGEGSGGSRLTIDKLHNILEKGFETRSEGDYSHQHLLRDLNLLLTKEGGLTA